MVNTGPITKELSTSAYYLIIIFYIIGAIFLFFGYSFYKDREDSDRWISNRWILFLLIGLVAIVIGSIPYMYNAPVMPTITRNGNVITVTNYASLGTNPSIELWGFYQPTSNKSKIYDRKTQFNETNKSWTYTSSVQYTNFAVRNYVGGLVFSQSAYL
jgi:hypothetical protein